MALVEMQGWRERTPAEMAQALHFLRWADDTIGASVKAVEAEAEAMIRQGAYVPGWGLTQRHGQTRVTAPPAAIKALTGGAITGDKTVPMGVGDLRAAIKTAGLPETILSLLTTRPIIGAKLTPLDSAALADQFTTPK
jgi:hypothetical protein